jgi:hypothetical protein
MDPERTTNMISQGPTDNLLWHVVLHDTYNAKGEPTADVMYVDVRCVG